MSVKIIFNSPIPPRPYTAMALGNLILVRDDQITTQTLAHELVHVDQYKRLGFFKFLRTWAFEYLTKGYWNISLEKEAYAKQDDPEYVERAKLILKDKGIL